MSLETGQTKFYLFKTALWLEVLKFNKIFQLLENW